MGEPFSSLGVPRPNDTEENIVKYLTAALAAFALVLGVSGIADARPMKDGPVNTCGDLVQTRLHCVRR